MPNLRVHTVAPLLADAIACNYEFDSVSSLFKKVYEGTELPRPEPVPV